MRVAARGGKAAEESGVLHGCGGWRRRRRARRRLQGRKVEWRGGERGVFAGGCAGLPGKEHKVVEESGGAVSESQTGGGGLDRASG